MRNQFRTPSMSAKTERERHKKLPVFVFPEELQFSVEDETSHKQVLTIYNPYDFNIRFQVLSNAPQKYAVVETQGSIKSHCCIDIVVRHKAVTNSSLEATDKFRVDTFIGNKLVGQKQVLSSVVKSKTPTEAKEKSGAFMSLPGNVGSSVDSNYGQSHDRQVNRLPQQGPGLLMMVVGLVCLFLLLLPLDGESPGWPSYAHVSVNQKLIAAFALGLITMALLKS